MESPPPLYRKRPALTPSIHPSPRFASVPCVSAVLRLKVFIPVSCLSFPWRRQGLTKTEVTLCIKRGLPCMGCWRVMACLRLPDGANKNTGLLLPKASWCAQHTMRPNKPKSWKSQGRFVAGPSKGNRWLVLRTPRSPWWFSGRSTYRQNLGVGLQGVAFFWLVAGEVTGWFSRNLVLSLKLPSSTWVGALVPVEGLKDIVMYIPWGGTRILL